MRVPFAAGLAAAGAAASACGTPATQCQCGDTTVLIEVPAERAANVVGVTLSGRGCETATAQCTQPVAGGCAEYAFEGTGVGVCDVEVQFHTDPADFKEEVSFAGYACCPGFYVQPPGATPIVVTGGPADAGGAG
jgi:hypothetical protein